ncbi:GntR family transcriptional regulator [Muricomes intestini]|jgi:GntR family transcriptional regulator|uniref:GntR family transcriptional regulator n=2 Tax=Muricomes intestini TaxID=1796634 RepID=UPI002FE04931
MQELDFGEIPLYLQIRRTIYEKIINGEYKPGEKLPSEDKLAEVFGVSRITINKALAELMNQEYLIREQGRGTFVSKMRKEKTGRKSLGFSQSLVSKGFKVDTFVYKKEKMIPNKEIAQTLKVPVTREVIHLQRLRSVNKNPVVLQESYVFTNNCDRLLEIDFEKESLYEVLKNEFHEEVVTAKDTIEAIGAQGEMCEKLQVIPGFPILRAKRVASTQEGKNVEMTTSLYRGDQYVLEVEYK